MKLPALLLVCAALAFSQCATFTGKGPSNLVASLDAKVCVQKGAGPPTSIAGTAGWDQYFDTTNLYWYDCTVTGTPGTWVKRGSSADILRFGICIAAGCGSETTINYIATMGAGSFTECTFNLATAATGSSVIVDVQDGSGTSIFGATKLVVTVANGTAVEYQSTFASSPQTYARGSKYRAVILQNDSSSTAQGGTVQCR